MRTINLCSVLRILATATFAAGCGGSVSGNEPAGPGLDAGSDTNVETGPGGPCAKAKAMVMVKLPEGYSIDSTEVTRCQYQGWLDTKPSTAGQDPWCAWNDDFAPPSTDKPVLLWPPTVETADFPVGAVDWCDAFAFCKAMGKRLCGRIGGGPLAWDDAHDPSKGEWMNACSAGGKYTFAYGNEYDNGTKCNDADGPADPELLVASGSLVGCQSPDPQYAGVFDMAGNVWEWEDSCEGADGGLDRCSRRGGSVASVESTTPCGFNSHFPRGDIDGAGGFRCCSQ